MEMHTFCTSHIWSVHFTRKFQSMLLSWRRVLLILGVFFLIPDTSTALTDVSVSIPSAVKRGDNAILICNYNLENDNLYTVKWYRGRREFYRYTPKENPSLKIFRVGGGFMVDISESNATHVFIRNPASGKYSCEVSADAPTFDTIVVTGEMEVVELPTQRPVITGIHSRYRLGDIINGNCSSDVSKPTANLTWWINEMQVPQHSIRTFDVQRHFTENLESTVLEINFIITPQHFIKGRLKLKCIARIYDIYIQEAEKLIEEDRPRILASGRSPELNMYPFDHLPGAEGFDEHNELYLTRYSNYPSAAIATTKISRESQILTAAAGLLLVTALNGFVAQSIKAIIQTSHKGDQTKTTTYATENRIFVKHCQNEINKKEFAKKSAIEKNSFKIRREVNRRR